MEDETNKTKTRSLLTRIKNTEIDLLEIPIVGKLLTWRGFQPFLQLVTFAVFSFIIATGIIGSPVGSANFSIIFVWIFWFVLIIWFLIPVLGRFWATVCPLPAPAEWLSRLSLYRKFRERFSLGLKWPEKLDNLWLHNAIFLVVLFTSPILLTRARVTGLLLLPMIILPIMLDLVFTSRDRDTGNERAGRIFCRYVCPFTGFVGLYAMLAPFGMRVRDKELCENHKQDNPTCKECVAGAGAGTDNSAKPSRNPGFGCPWFVYPGELDRNSYCGLCTECIKTCPLDNTTFRFSLSAVGQDLFKAGKRHLDEVYKAFILLAGAGFFTAVMLGWWPKLRDIGNYITGLTTFHPAQFGLYVLFLLSGTLVVVPGLHLLFTSASRWAAGGKTDKSLKELFIHHGYALIPHGFFIWFAFCFSFAFISGSYILNVLNDPFGWGWNLFGLAGLSWTPVLSGWVPVFQAVVLTGGLAASIYVTLRISKQIYRTTKAALRATGVYTTFLIAITWGFLYLYIG